MESARDNYLRIGHHDSLIEQGLEACHIVSYEFEG